MGFGYIYAAESLRQRMMNDPLIADEIKIVKETYEGDGLWSLRVSSPLLPKGEQGQQELVIEDSGKPRFKPARDHDIGAGRPFRMEGD